MTEKDLGQIIPDILATATVDNKVGEPAVNVTVEQINEVNRLERKFNFEFVNMKGEKGDKPVKGVDYLTEEEKQQFTTETVGLVTAEGAKQVKAVTDKASEQISKVSSQGNDQISLVSAEGQKVVEQVKKLIGVNPAGGDAVSVGGKTRVEFEKDTQALAGKYNGNFPLTSAVKDAVYLVPTAGKFYICNESYSGKSLSEPNENFEELSVFKIREKLDSSNEDIEFTTTIKRPVNIMNPKKFIQNGYYSDYGNFSQTTEHKYAEVEGFEKYKGHTLRAYSWDSLSKKYIPTDFFQAAVYVNNKIPYPLIVEHSENNSALTIQNNLEITKIILSVKNNVQLITVDMPTPPSEYREYTTIITRELNKETFKAFYDSHKVTNNMFTKITEKSRNVYNPKTWKTGKIIDINGNINAEGSNIDFLTSPKIEIKNGQSLAGYGLKSIGSTEYIDRGFFYTILDKNSKPLIKTLPGTSSVVNIRDIPNAKYIIISTDKNYTKMILLGNTVAKTENGKIIIEDNNDTEIFFEGKRTRKYLIVANGDSITYGSRTSIELYPNMIQGISYIDYIANELNTDLLKFAIPSSSCALHQDGTDRSNALCLRYKEMPDNADLVYIAIGSNDWAAQSIQLGTMGDKQNTTFYGALNILCDGLLEKYPNIPILFATPIKRWEEHNTNPQLNPNKEDIYLYCNAIKEVCGYYGIPVIDVNNECWLNPWIERERLTFIPDGIHPNELGQRKMANCIKGFIKKYLY